MVGDVFGPAFAFESIRTLAEEFVPLVPESFHLGWGNAGPANEVEKEKSDKLFVAKELHLEMLYLMIGHKGLKTSVVRPNAMVMWNRWKFMVTPRWLTVGM